LDYLKLKTLLLNRIAVKIAFFLNGFILANWVSRLPRIQEMFHADDGMIGLVLLCLSTGAVIAMPFTGWMITQNGSRRVTLVSVIAYALLIAFIPIMPGIIGLMLLFFITGIVTGTLDVAMNAQAVIVEQKYRKPIMTSFHALFSIGMAIGAWSGALFADLGSSLLNHFTLIAASSLMAALWVSRNLVYDRPEKNAVNDGPLFRIPNKTLISVGVIAFCCMIGEGAMSEWSVNYMENISHASKSMAPLALSAFATAMTIGRLFGDRIRSRFGDSKLITCGGLLAIAGLTITLTYGEPEMTIAGFFIVGMGLASIVPITYSIAGNAEGLPSGVGIAMVTTVGYTGFLFGPPVIGFISDAFDLRVGLGVVLILFVVMTILGLMRRSK
jgi:MFS family permease